MGLWEGNGGSVYKMSGQGCPQGRLATCRTVIVLDKSSVWNGILIYQRNPGNKAEIITPQEASTVKASGDFHTKINQKEERSHKKKKKKRETWCLQKQKSPATNLFIDNASLSTAFQPGAWVPLCSL